ncbi:hypothetical protein D5086_030311, partial [Populus alba]
RSIQKLIVKAKEKISGNDLSSSQKPDSMNKKPSPLSSSSETRPAGKRALLIGVTYKRKHKLKGTINDVKSMRELLILNFGFKEENILVLTEQEIEPELSPTKKNILKSLEWLVKGCQAGDSLVFYFSGHGLSQPDFEGDERDGFAENICPVDFMTEGMIVDNDINSTIVWPLKKGVTLHAIVDACHSGTVLDLEHVYNRQESLRFQLPNHSMFTRNIFFLNILNLPSERFVLDQLRVPRSLKSSKLNLFASGS